VDTVNSEHTHAAGVEVIDCDKYGHTAYLKDGGACYDPLIQVFGSAIVDEETGEIDRKKLGTMTVRVAWARGLVTLSLSLASGAVVFAKTAEGQAALQRLNSIVWPHIIASVQRDLREARRSRNVSIAFVEAAIMLEAGWYEVMDEVWLIVASERVRSPASVT
jgi:dephospho-CoA kinase